jgi:hypothetical protein
MVVSVRLTERVSEAANLLAAEIPILGRQQVRSGGTILWQAGVADRGFYSSFGTVIRVSGEMHYGTGRAVPTASSTPAQSER